MRRAALSLLLLVPLLAASECDGNQHHRTQSGQVAPIPEPTAGLLFAAGLLVFGLRRPKR